MLSASASTQLPLLTCEKDIGQVCEPHTAVSHICGVGMLNFVIKLLLQFSLTCQLGVNDHTKTFILIKTLYSK